MTKEQYRIPGTGNRGNVCLLFVRSCGIGDDVCALPAVSELAKDNRVTVYTLHPELWMGLPITVVGVTGDDLSGYRDAFGRTLDMLWEDIEFPNYEWVYQLGGWGIWEDDTLGYNYRPRFEQIASLLDVDLPKSFDFAAALGCVPVANGYTLLAAESHGHFRSLSEDKASLLYLGIQNFENVVWLTSKKPHSYMLRCNSWQELLIYVANAERVIAVDNGIAHLAAALGKPLTVIGGMTDVRGIYSQYARYNPGWSFTAVQLPFNECLSPCYGLTQRGFSGPRGSECCGEYKAAQCMKSVNPDEVLALAFGVATCTPVTSSDKNLQPVSNSINQ